MYIDSSSLTVVLIGDWNKLYMRPDWIASNVFTENEIEVGVHGIGATFSISFRKKNVAINPTQEKVIFSAFNVEQETVEYLCKCVNNFIRNANSAVDIEYGFNCSYIDDDKSHFSEILDSISDVSLLISADVKIRDTEINRVLEINGNIVSMNTSENEENVIVQFNEHHREKLEQLDCQRIFTFIEECRKLLLILEYEVEDDEE